jgi:hypothetical protein
MQNSDSFGRNIDRNTFNSSKRLENPFDQRHLRWTTNAQNVKTSLMQPMSRRGRRNRFCNPSFFPVFHDAFDHSKPYTHIFIVIGHIIQNITVLH